MSRIPRETLAILLKGREPFSLPPHPYAEIFPMMDEAARRETTESIAVSGIREEIVLFTKPYLCILDGRNRYDIGKEVGLNELDLPFRFFGSRPDDGLDPLEFVLDLNLRRRHLDESQRAMVAAKYANISHGGNRKPSEQAANLPLEPESPPPAPVTQAQAAETLNVSERSVRAAKNVLEHGVEPLKQSVEQGELAVSTAEQIAAASKEEQENLFIRIERDDKGKLTPESKKALGDFARELRAEKMADKKKSWEAREQKLAAKIQALPDKQYGVILMDYARRHNTYSRETGLDRCPENHYPTMTFRQILDLPVPKLAGPKCLLVFWSTAASLIDDLEIMAEWGFIVLRMRDENGKLLRDAEGNPLAPPRGARYRSMQVWNKEDGFGLGRWFRDTHEFVLLGVKGNDFVAPLPGTQDKSSFTAPLGEHSEKPEQVHLWIERHWPNVPKVELFARGDQARPGWDVWGYEAPNPPAFELTSIKFPCCAARQPLSESDLDIPNFLRREAPAEPADLRHSVEA